MRRDFPIVPDGWLYISLLIIITGLVFLWNPYLSLLPLFLLLGVAFFFRNPDRNIPLQPDTIVSPADGKVMSVEKIIEDSFFQAEVTRIRIFLSIFNVHINRSPIDGTVVYQEYRSGKFLPAFQEEAAIKNEQNLVGMQNDDFRILVNQIAGIIARRVVSWVKPGDSLKKGERFGLIKFGSCTEIYVPVNVKVEVKKGDQVKGGETIIGRVIR